MTTLQVPLDVHGNGLASHPSSPEESLFDGGEYITEKDYVAEDVTLVGDDDEGEEEEGEDGEEEEEEGEDEDEEVVSGEHEKSGLTNGLSGEYQSVSSAVEVDMDGDVSNLRHRRGGGKDLRVRGTTTAVVDDNEPPEPKKSKRWSRYLPRLAPLRIPFVRRLQTIAVLWHELALGISLTLFWSLLANPFLWPLLLPYLLHLLFSAAHHNGASPHIRSPYLRSLKLWRWFNDFFPIRIHRSCPLDPKGNYIFGYQPHGIISIGAWGAFVTDDGVQGDPPDPEYGGAVYDELDANGYQDTRAGYMSAPGGGFGRLFPGIRNTLLTLDGNFRIPLYREYLLSMGLGSVSRRSCEALLGGQYPLRNPLPARRRSSTSSRPRSKTVPHEEVPWGLKHPISILLWLWHFFISLLPVFLPPILHPYLSKLPSNPPGPPPPTTVGTSTTGNAITIVLGGAHESLLTLPKTYRLILNRRRGFLKLALRSDPNNPVGVVPVLAFGENDLYETLVPEKGTWLWRWQRWVKKWLGWTVPVFWARGVFNYDVGLVPFRRRVEVVVGRPVLARRFREGWADAEEEEGADGEGGKGGKKGREVTEEEVDELQREYVDELKRLWDEWKNVFAKDRRGELEIVE